MTYFLAGIKGSGMASLACMLHDLGNYVLGYDDDKHYSFTEDELNKRNINYLALEKDLKKGMIFIYTSAINCNHLIYKKAKELDLEIYEYYKYIGYLTSKFETISICGTHGKTTTTALLAHVLNNTIGCNYLIGDGEGKINKDSNLFILESCEYKRHLLSYFPKYTILTNIDLDHVDCYNNIDEIIDTFSKFVDKTKDKVIACGDNKNIRKIQSNKIIYYGLEDDNDIIAKNIILNKEGSEFDVYIKGNLFGHFKLHIYGKHMIQNALAVIYMSKLLGISYKDIKISFENFHGAKRRFSEKKINDVILVDDYAHHPNEVKTVIETAKQKYPDKLLIPVLIPYTISRTKAFYKDFALVLKDCDKVFVTDIEPAREDFKDYPGVSSDLIIDLIPGAESIGEDCINKLYKYKNAVIMFMGCKDPTWLIDAYMKGL